MKTEFTIKVTTSYPDYMGRPERMALTESERAEAVGKDFIKMLESAIVSPIKLLEPAYNMTLELVPSE